MSGIVSARVAGSTVVCMLFKQIRHSIIVFHIMKDSSSQVDNLSRFDIHILKNSIISICLYRPSNYQNFLQGLPINPVISFFMLLNKFNPVDKAHIAVYRVSAVVRNRIPNFACQFTIFKQMVNILNIIKTERTFSINIHTNACKVPSLRNSRSDKFPCKQLNP